MSAYETPGTVKAQIPFPWQDLGIPLMEYPYETEGDLIPHVR